MAVASAIALLMYGPAAYPCFPVMDTATLYIKQRTVYCRPNRATAWQAFERMCAGDMQLLPVEAHVPS